MSNLLKLIEQRSEKLYKNSLCQWIASEESNALPPQTVLSFTPAMLYFIMGFKDILESLEYQQPKNKFEAMVNQHCLEDKNHWRWYLEDLETLGFSSESWGPDFISRIEKLWSDSNKPTRDLVYTCIHLTKKFQNAQAALVIIECLEATFGVFMTSLQKRFWNSPTYSRLQFFGQTHHHQEANHSMGHWIEDETDEAGESKHYWEELQFSAQEEQQLSEAIHLIFEQFERVFESWLAAKDDFLSKEPNQELRPIEFN